MLSGCYVNHALVDPWSVSPLSSAGYWTPPEAAKKQAAPVSELPEVPEGPTPLSLAEAIDIGLKNNAQTKLTWAEARAAAAQYAQTQSAALPTLDGQYTLTRFREFVTFNNKTEAFFQTQWGPQVSLSYVIFDFGQRRATSEAARMALYFSDWTHNRAIQTAINTITNDYYGYLYQVQLLDALEADVENAQVTLDDANAGLSTGVKTVSDTLLATTQLLQKQTQFTAQQQNVKNSYAQLLTDMGVPANTEVTLQDLPEATTEQDMRQDLNALLSEALQQRADLLAAEANVRSKQESIRAARRQFYPTLQYNFDIGRTNFNGGFNDNYNFQGTLALTFPIFSGFNLDNNVRAAEAQKEAAEAQLLQTQLTVIENITTAHYNVKIAAETLELARSYLKAAEEQLRVAVSQYKAGTNTILDVVTAQTSVADARAQKAQAVQQWFSSLANLTYAVGAMKISTQNKQETYDQP